MILLPTLVGMEIGSANACNWLNPSIVNNDFLC
jgi:hypothetical protein